MQDQISNEFNSLISFKILSYYSNKCYIFCTRFDLSITKTFYVNHCNPTKMLHYSEIIRALHLKCF